jgi:predicted benzoate:H+ symporter BenE
MNDFGQAVASAQALAEGQEIRPQSAKRSTTPAWMYVMYVFAALFALQLLFILLTLGISLVAGG